MCDALMRVFYSTEIPPNCKRRLFSISNGSESPVTESQEVSFCQNPSLLAAAGETVCIHTAHYWEELQYVFVLALDLEVEFVGLRTLVFAVLSGVFRSPVR